MTVEMAGRWTSIPCGCCNGLQWGGEYPRECRRCEGSGAVWLSPSGTRLAVWPGGPFRGIANDDDRSAAAQEWLRAEDAAIRYARGEGTDADWECQLCGEMS